MIIISISIISTRAINSAIRQAAIPGKWLRFARLPARIVVFALVVMFLGLLCWGLSLAVFAPAIFFALCASLNPFNNSWPGMIIVMLIAVIVAARAINSQQ